MSVWKPLLLRAIVAAAFGVLTIFWQEPSLAVLVVAGGLYLLATGACALVLARCLPADRASAKPVLRAEAVVLAVGAAVVFVLPSAGVFAAAASAALLFSGGMELYLGLKHRGRFAAARDWVITGAIGVGTGALLPLFVDLQAHALLGVVGGSAILIAVLLGLAALGYRHDAASAGPAVAAEGRRRS